jgi:hypothetical protein
VGALSDRIRRAVRDERYVFGSHADERLRDRKIKGWQIIEGLDAARVLRERPNDHPNPAVEFEQALPDGTMIQTAWSWIATARTAKLVTFISLTGKTMGTQGKRTKVERWIHADACVVRVEVEAIIPDADPSEACLEPKTIHYLDELQRKADMGMIHELAKSGDVYVRQSA